MSCGVLRKCVVVYWEGMLWCVERVCCGVLRGYVVVYSEGMLLCIEGWQHPHLTPLLTPIRGRLLLLFGRCQGTEIVEPFLQLLPHSCIGGAHLGDLRRWKGVLVGVLVGGRRCISGW